MEDQIFKEFMRALIKDSAELRLVELLVDGQDNEAILAELVALAKKKSTQ